MNPRLLVLLGAWLWLLLGPWAAHAQSAGSDRAKAQADSARLARQHIQDSIKIEREYRADSVRISRQQKADSIQEARKRKTDSTASVRRYKESKRYRDSITKSKTLKLKAVTKGRQAKMDSVKAARQQAMDSIATVRKERTDGIKKAQKRRGDSVAARTKYRNSKRYADSVAIVKHNRTDSIKNYQQAIRDSVAGIRKQSMDSAKTARKRVLDSTKLVRTRYTDSIKVVRKAKTDSLAKKKAEREKIAKAKEKKKAEDLKIQIEIKMKKKHEAWSNKSMLKKKWSPVRRVVQNSFTHYNYYYNANKKMDEAMANMLRSRSENYDTLIGLYPFDPNTDSSLLASDMDSIAHKVSVGIQIHDPRVKWSNDMYLLLGQSFYYRGKYENAAIAFRYIISSNQAAKKKAGGVRSKDGPSILENKKKTKLDFLKHKSVHNEAILWLARTYTQAGQVENTESVLSLLEADSKLPASLKGRLAIEKAFAALALNNPQEATHQLGLARDDKYLPDWLRLRVSFLHGQLLQEQQQYKAAAASFEKSLDYYPKLEMDFYARKNIAFNKLQSGEQATEAMKPLKSMLHDAKYASYYDQVYYVLGKLASKANHNSEAIGYLNKSVATPKASKKQKSLSFTALGDIYYNAAQYAYAKRAYDSAGKYGSSRTAAAVATAQRSKVLAEISGPLGVIHDQDSLLLLAAKSNKEQLAIVRRQLNYLEKRRRDSINKAENAALNTAAGTAEAEAGEADANAWYFANPTLVQQGNFEFKRKWGSRPLADNWRRAAAINTSVSSTGSGGSGDEEEEETTDKDKGKLTEAALMAKIPNTPEQKEKAQKAIHKAYIQLATAYMIQLDDYKRATGTLDTLNKRFPSHTQKEEELYLRYQLAIRQNKLDEAQGYSQKLVAQFPDSKYVAALKPKRSESGGGDGGAKTVAKYFDETYDLVMQHQYTEALMRIKIADKEYDDPLFKKRFQVAEAMAYAGSSDFDKADTVISKFLKANPADTLTPWAQTVQQYIKDVRNGGKPSWYRDTPPGEAIAKKDTKAGPPKPKLPPPPPPIPPEYVYDAAAEHYCVLALPGLDARTIGLKKAVRSFDSSKYGALALDIRFDLYDIDHSVLTVRRFPDAAQAREYLAALKASPALAEYTTDELKAGVISANNFKKLNADKVAAPYFYFYTAYYK